MISIDALNHSLTDECLLLHELTHRVNNEFAAAIGIISVATATSASTEVGTAMKRVLRRLESLARVHHALQIPDHDTDMDIRTYLRQLCEAISRSQLEHRGIKLILSEHSFLISSVRCWILGMILAELIYNAARHAFHAVASHGEVRVEVLPRGDLIECRVRDNGAAAVCIQAGRGLKIVEALARRLDGKIEHQFGMRGSVSTLTFPLASDSAHAR